MFDFFIPMEMYDRVMGNDKIKNKFLGYFWRVEAFYAALFGAFLVMITLASQGSVWRNLNAAVVLGYALIGLILCVDFPLFSYWLASRKAGKEKEDK